MFHPDIVNGLKRFKDIEELTEDLKREETLQKSAERAGVCLEVFVESIEEAINQLKDCNDDDYWEI